MVAYRRYYIKGGTWFFTVNLKDRRSMHLTENIELLRYSVAVVSKRQVTAACDSSPGIASLELRLI
ncbi:hypothetical protein NUKP76_32450 [Klebsiella variicola]|nr:hypothetical protein NUKP76_32450 [Klebsiella variicola]